MPMNKTVERVVAILQALADAKEPLGMAALWKQLDLPKSSSSNIINSLIELEMLEFNEEDANALEPGARFFELSARFVSKNRLLPVARANMVQLARDTGQTVFLAMFDGRSLMFIEKVEAPGHLQSYYSPGELLPMHASASGKAVLATKDDGDVRELLGKEPFEKFNAKTVTGYKALFADLNKTRKRKYSVENKEKENYLAAVGAPVRQVDGNTVAAISLVNLNTQMTAGRIEETGPLIYATAFRISRYLGFSGSDLFLPIAAKSL